MDYVKEAEGYLRSYPDLVESIENINKELEYLEEEITGAKAIDYSGMPGGGGASLPDDRLVNLLYQKQIKERALDLTKKKIQHIDSILTQLSEGEGNEQDEKVLRKFFIENLRGQALEKEFGVSERHVYRMKGKAIRRFAIQFFGVKIHGE
jgi:DNA-directed RNA polymerase specialized sigma subunit